MSLASVILAAGQGTRMNSKLPKVLHPVAGKPMIEYALDAARTLGTDKPVLVVGYQSDQVRAAVGERAQFVEQRELLGTGHAVLQARNALLGRADTVMVTYADMPLLTTETLQQLYAKHQQAKPCATMLTLITDAPMDFGRIVRDVDGKIQGIVEVSEATPAQLAIKEFNCGVYCFEAHWLWEHLPQVQPSPKKKEYFLTDLIEMAAREHAPIESETLRDVDEVIGINTRVQLAQAEQIMRRRINERLMLSGVTMIDPAATYIDAEVEIGPDTVILPGTHIQGKTVIGSDCRIGPDAQILECRIGNGCKVGASLLEQSTLEDKVQIGPYCHLRPGTYLGAGVHLGDHAELKNARLGPGTKMGHFSYLGDAEVGARVNIGAGTITCNYDGKKKSRTVIGDDAFIGSDTMLVAPVTVGARVNIGAGTITCNYDGKKKSRTVIGDDAFIGSDTMLVAPVTVGARAKTGAGSVVTKDIPPNSLAYGVPARVTRTLTEDS